MEIVVVVMIGGWNPGMPVMEKSCSIQGTSTQDGHDDCKVLFLILMQDFIEEYKFLQKMY